MDGSLILVDESRLFREGLRGILDRSPFQIEHEASSVDELIEQQDRFADIKPDLVLFDSQDDNPTLARQLECLAKILPHTRIVFLTNQVRMSRLALAFSAGVDGYLLKDLSADALRESLGLVLVGEKVYPSSLAALLIDSYLGHGGNEPVNGHAVGALSARERQILDCLALGHPNKTIARQLGITESTVKGHLKVLLSKIKVSNRTQAAIWALSNGHTSGHRRTEGASDRRAPEHNELARE